MCCHAPFIQNLIPIHMRAVLKDCNKNEDLFRHPTYKHLRTTVLCAFEEFLSSISTRYLASSSSNNFKFDLFFTVVIETLINQIAPSQNIILAVSCIEKEAHTT